MDQIPKPASIKYNFAYLIFGNGINLVGQFGTLLLLHRFCSIEDVGRFLLGLGITAPIILFTGLSLMQVQGTDAAQRFSFGHYLGARYATNTIAMVLTVIVASFFGIGSKTFLIVSLVGLMKAVEHISNVIQGYFYRIEHMKYAAYSRMLHGIVAVVFFGITLLLTRSVVFGILTVSLGYGAIVYLYDLRIASRYTNIRPYFHWEILFKLGRKAFPLAIVAGLNSLNTNLYRYVLMGYLGEASVGVFGTMSYVIVGLNQFCIALSHSALPRMAKYYNDLKSRYFLKLLFKLLVIGAGTGITAIFGTILFGRFFLRLFASELAEYNNVFVVVVGSGALLFIGGILGDVLVASQKFMFRALSMAVSTVVGLVSAILMISRWGIEGAAWAGVISNSVRVFIMGILLFSVIRAMHQRYEEKASQVVGRNQ